MEGADQDLESRGRRGIPCEAREELEQGDPYDQGPGFIEAGLIRPEAPEVPCSRPPPPHAPFPTVFAHIPLPSPVPTRRRRSKLERIEESLERKRILAAWSGPTVRVPQGPAHPRSIRGDRVDHKTVNLPDIRGTEVELEHGLE